MNQMYATAMMWIVSAIALSVTVCVAPLQSQTVLAQPLQQLGWLPAPNPEFSAARALGVDFAFRDCAIGWNWLSASAELSSRYHQRLFHCTRFYAQQAEFNRTFVERQRLIPNVYLNNGRTDPVPIRLSANAALTDHNIPWYLDMYESGAIEYQPWLRYDVSIGRTDATDIPSNDEAGGVFCFSSQTSTQFIGQRVADAGTPTIYRLHLATTDANVTVPILSGVWPNDGLKRWDPLRNETTETQMTDPNGVSNDFHNDVIGVCQHNAYQNTSRMYVSVTLRRTEDDAVGANLDEVILRLRVPYWYFGETVPGTSPKLIVFDSVPHPTDASALLAYGAAHPLQQVPQSPPGDLVTEIVITRRMLPALNSANREVTFSGYFICDIPSNVIDSTTFPAHHQRRFNTVKGKATNLISRMSVDVIYEGHVGIDIRNVRLETPEARRILWGAFDAMIQSSINTALDDLNTAHIGMPGATPADADRARIWRFYGRDEILPMHWRTFRHMQHLLHGNLTTEWNVYWQELASHCLELREWWQGQAAMPAPGPLTPSTVFKRGYNAKPASVGIMQDYAEIKYGMDEPEMFNDPDLKIASTSTPPTLPVGDPIGTIYEATYEQHHGYTAAFEELLWTWYAKQPQIMFGASTTWMANPWLFLEIFAFGQRPAATAPQVVPPNLSFGNQPRTSGMVRHALTWPLVLGARQLAIYEGVSHSPFPLTPPQNQPADVEALLLNLGCQRQNELRPAGAPAGTIDQLIDADDIGSEYLTEGNDAASNDRDFHNMRPYFYLGFANVVDHLYSSPGSPRSLYLGRRTTRQVLREVADQFNAMYSQLGRTTITPALTEHPLATATIVSWHAKGYSSWTQERTGFAGTLSSIIDTASLLSRHPHRYNTTIAGGSTPGSIWWEPKDSMFADIGVFAVHDPAQVGALLPTNTAFLLTVSNRRTDSRMLASGMSYTTDVSAAWSFVDNDQYNARVAADPAQRFMQRGARQIRLPFKFAHIDGRYRLLRIRELGGGIDTVVGQDRELAVDFLPGQGRFFRVDVLPADDAVRTNTQDVSRGFLAHNTQRKLVHFPQVTGWSMHTEPKPVLGDNDPGCAPRQYMRTTNGNTMRYHLVYHRRTNPDQPLAADNRLDVFYQRSAPMPIRCTDEDDCADLGAVQWENPITLNAHIVESVTYNESEHRFDTIRINPIDRPSCAYPSVVVRYDQYLQKSRVYVVYACEEDNPATNHDVVIYEAQLDADVSAATQANDYTTASGRSFQLDNVVSNPNCPVSERLSNWGTPVINASYRGNYYAWSDYVRGIVYGHKVPTVRQMTLAERKFVKVNNDQGSVAQFPTLNTYSRLHIGEEECALAWQEGHYQISCNEGEKIYYTQLSLMPATTQARRGLHSTGMLTNLTALPTFSWDAVRQENTVALVSEAGVFNSKPSIIRTLSDYDQAGYTTTSTVQSYTGGSRHKADRLFWTHQYPLVTANIARRSIDVVERAPCTNQDVGELWSGPVGYIFGQSNLSSPEVSLGESKTVLLGSPAAQSWAYDDTCYVLSFNQASANPQSPAIWHAALGWRLMGQAAPTTVDQAYGLIDLKNYAFVHKNSVNGRNPHSSTTYSQSLSFGLTKGRRVFEQPPFVDLSWNQAPSIWRSSEGFYKREMTYSGEGSSRMFVGFRADAFDAMLAQTVIDGLEGFMLKCIPYKANAVGHSVLVSDWQQLPSSFDLSVPTISDGQAFDNARAYIERQSDLQQLELPIFENAQGLQSASERTREHVWKSFANTEDLYRLVVECTQGEAEVTTDVELEPLPPDAKQAKPTVNAAVLDLRTMKTIESSVNGTLDGAIDVLPQPASEMVTILIASPSGIRAAQPKPSVTDLVIADLTGREVLRIPIAMSPTTHTIADINVSELPTGVYTVSAGMTNVRAMMHIAR